MSALARVARARRLARAPVRAARLGVWLAGCLAITLLLTLASLLVGTSSIETSLGWLLSPDAQSSVILWQIRLPRTVGAWFAGALLGLAGAIAQGVFRNPLADPYLLGTASGAALGVTISLIAARCLDRGTCLGRQDRHHRCRVHRRLRGDPLTIMLSRGVLQTANLLLAGIVVAFLSERGDLLLLLTQAGDLARRCRSSCSAAPASAGPRPAARRRVLPLLVPATLLARGLDALELRRGHGAIAGPLAADAATDAARRRCRSRRPTAVGQVGIVGFVGLVAPHLVRETLSVNHRQLLIGAPLCGGALLQAADLVSRWIIRPAELPVGAVTACVGGAYLVFLLWRRSRDD